MPTLLLKPELWPQQEGSTATVEPNSRFSRVKRSFSTKKEGENDFIGAMAGK